MAGHIKLGTSVALLRDYILTNPQARVRELANPYAAKVGMGAGKYDDLIPWSAWVMDDWQRGVGREKVEDGGMAYSSLDSRVPGQLILPPAMGRVAAYHGAGTNGQQQFFPADCTSYETVTIGAGQTYDTLLVKVVTGTGTRRSVDLYARLHAAAVGDTITYEPMTWSDNAGAPDTQLSNTGVTITATAEHVFPKFKWWDAGVTYASFADSTTYWVGFRVTVGYMTILLGGGNSSSSTIVGAGGAAPWTTKSTDAIFQVCEDDESTVAYVPLRQYAWMGDNATGSTFMIGDQDGYAAAYQYNNAANAWTYKDKTSTTCTFKSNHCAAWGGSIYIPAGDSTTFTYGAFDGTTISEINSYNFQGFAAANGYLWAWKDNEVWYTNKTPAAATDWIGPIYVGPSQFDVKSVCQFGEFAYVATEDALWYIGYGDVAIGVLRFPSRSTETGVSMCEFQGTLYIAVAGRVWQYSGTGQAMDVWLPYTGDTDIQRGDVVAIAATSQNLYAAALPDTGQTSDQNWYVYSWNGQGWHPVMIARPPWSSNGTTYSSMCSNGFLYYGRNWNKLFLVATPYYTYWARLPDSFLNPFRDTAHKYGYTGYMTTPWFDGDLIDVDKDYESIFITGESLAANAKLVDIYWQDDASTAWEYLGRADSIGEEVRWSTYATRPNTKRIRLAFVFYTTSPTATPQVTGIRVKYRANVMDRWRWTLPVALTPTQQFPDGSVNAYTVAQMRTHLDGLVKQVPPVFFQDVDGATYECWVTGCREQIIEYERYNSAHQFMQQYLISLEQVQSAAVA